VKGMLVVVAAVSDSLQTVPQLLPGETIPSDGYHGR
jgi:hypothetical protein